MRTLVVLSLSWAAACGGEPPWAGSYTASATWNVSGPLAHGRTAGDAVADLLIDTLVAQGGIPDAVADEAHTQVSSLIRADVKAAVDAQAPQLLAPDGAVTQALGAALASLEVESAITLEEGFLPNSLEGQETITTLAFHHAETRYELSPSDLYGGAMQGEWSGSAGDTTLDVEPHGLPLHYGELVLRVASLVIDEAGLTALKNDMVAAVQCGSVVGAILDGDASLDVGVAGIEYSFGADGLDSACDAARALLEGRALGLFTLDSGVVIGGTIEFADETLASGTGFGGYIGVAPEAIAPQLDVTMTAKR
jgi:hypothetical protein